MWVKNNISMVRTVNARLMHDGAASITIQGKAYYITHNTTTNPLSQVSKIKTNA